MRKFIYSLFAVLLLSGPMAWTQSQAQETKTPGQSNQTAPKTEPNTQQLRTEVEQLKQMLTAMEERLAAQEKKQQEQTAQETQDKVKDLDKRVTKTERDSALSRIRWGGDYRFEAHSIKGTIPAHFDGMLLQNLIVKSMFTMNTLGRPPASVNEINQTVAAHYGDYKYFTDNLTFDKLKQSMGQFPQQLQQQLFGMLMPSTFVPEYKDNNKILYTNRLRLKLDAPITENVSVTARLSMYKVFGDSTGVQVFNGQPSTLNIDGTTAGVPNGDMIRVERAYFTWNKIGGSKFFLSIGRRPSTDGPPMNYRDDELRGGTPSGALINYQFDGLTFGYHLGQHTVFRFCYGLGYESGFGNGDLLKRPEDRLKDVHFAGGNLDLWTSEKTLLQLTFARAFNVTDGFNGLLVLPNNPLTGDSVGAPVIMRFTPSANLGNINLAGINLTRKFRQWDVYGSLNFVALRPNGITTPFGGLGSDPFETPQSHNGYMFYAGARYSFKNEDRTKAGFEFNHGSKYWFNFAQAEDDIIAPKTNTRGNVFETYLTHRINSRFIVKADYIYYNYNYSGSGWHVGAPKLLDSSPILGFPTYKKAQMLTLSTTVRF
jgi:hypothetical protein